MIVSSSFNVYGRLQTILKTSKKVNEVMFFTFNLRFLYELKHKVRISKTVFWIFDFQFCFSFIKANIFVQQDPWVL